MRDLSNTLQHALVKAMNKAIEDICGKEAKARSRFPFVFYEEAHFYVTDAAILNIITRGRHIGMGSFFVTNTPQNLPDTVFRQLDNLFLLGLTHRDDIRNVSKNSFTDEDTIQSFATRMPKHHTLIIGQITERYPLVVSVDRLPEGVPETGRTRSTWDRFATAQTENIGQNRESEELPF
jgi:DNA helicase HerA-like ATPase